MNSALLAVHPSALTELRAATEKLPSGLILLHGPDTGLSFTAAHHLALEDARGPAAAAAPVPAHPDVHLAVSATGAWAVSEVEQLILRPARYRPAHRTHVVVADAHRMTPSAADRLLKALEEPRTDVLYWFCIPTPDAVQPTLRSRAAAEVVARPIPLADLELALRAAGADELATAELLELAPTNARLGLAVAAAGAVAQLRAFQRPFAHEKPEPAPSSRASEVVAAAAALARALRSSRPSRSAPTDARAAWDRLDPLAKAEGRRLLQDALASRARIAQRTLNGQTTNVTLRSVERTLEAVHLAHAELEVHTHPEVILAAFFARAARP